MSAVRYKFEDVGGSFARLRLRVLHLSKTRLRDFMEHIGSELEAQTRIRIEKEKTAPDGTPWDPWSESYAETKHGRTQAHQPHPGALYSSGGHTLLQLDGGLLDSIQYNVEGDEVIVGSNLKYSEPVNDARQFLGLSAENRGDLEDLVMKFFEKKLIA